MVGGDSIEAFNIGSSRSSIGPISSSTYIFSIVSQKRMSHNFSIEVFHTFCYIFVVFHII